MKWETQNVRGDRGGGRLGEKGKQMWIVFMMMYLRFAFWTKTR